MSIMRKSTRIALFALTALTSLAACGETKESTPAPTEIETTGAHRDAGQAADASTEEEPMVLHTVAEGETLWLIARAYELRVVDIMTANEMSDADARRMSVGAKLKIPGASEVRQPIRDDKNNPDAAPPDETRKDGIYHGMLRGETVWDLAGLFNVAVAEIMAANNLTAEDLPRLRAGQKIFIPGVKKDIRGKVTRVRSPGLTKLQRRAAARARRLGLGTRRAASMLLTGEVRPEWTRAARGKAGRLPGTLRWPVTKGWFVRGYGSGKDGYHLAVDIAGEIGWNVRSAAEGIVGYSDKGVKGYGNLVMVIHPGGWVTMYAHNSVNFVVAGQQVRRGQILAELGSTGISKGPHVHFEFIYDHENCDPAVLFRPGIRHRDGHLTPIEYTSWTNPRKKPRWVKCSKRRNYPHGAEPGDEDSESHGD